MKYANIILTIIALTLLWIGAEMCRIESGMADFRPVRTYYQNFDVAKCHTINISEEPILARPDDYVLNNHKKGDF